MFNGKQKGQEVLLAYVGPRFCSTHDTHDELQAMKSKHLTVFKRQKKESKNLEQAETRTDIMSALATHVIKQGKNSPSVVGSQMTDLNLLFCNPDESPFRRKCKTDGW